MELNIEGYLNPEHNPDLVQDGIWNETIKIINLKVLDKTTKIKIKNIIKNWSQDNLSVPIFQAREGGLIVRIATQKIRKYMCQRMIQTSATERLNKCYSVRVSIRKYSFRDRSTGNIIQ